MMDRRGNLTFDGVARGHREHAGAGHHQPGGRGCIGGLVKRLPDGRHGALLGIGIGTRCARLHQHQGARAVA